MTSHSESTIDSSINGLDLILKVDGMSCTSCATVIDSMLQKSKGITEAKTHFLADMVQVKYLPHLITPHEIQQKIADLGYHPSPFQEKEAHDAEKRNLLLRLGISALLSANVMMISHALYWGFFQELSKSSIWLLSLPQLILTTPVILYGGYPIQKRALAGLRQGKSTMDTLIACGALSAFGYSVIQMTRGSLHLYFDTAAMLVSLVLLGKYIEAWAQNVEIRYTTDGSAPRASSPLIAGPVALSSTATLSVRCFRDWKPVSGTASSLFRKTAPLPATPRGDRPGGVSYRYFEGDWDSLPRFEALEPAGEGTHANFSFAPRKDHEHFAFEYTGYVDAPRAGVYTFFTESDDGSRLYVGGELVVDNDGLHGMARRKGVVPLSAGLHPITVRFFEKSADGLVCSLCCGNTRTEEACSECVFYQKPKKKYNESACVFCF